MSKKLCKNCKHAITGDAVFGPFFSTIIIPWRCAHPDLVEPVEGISRRCDELRGSLECGIQGLKWEEGEPTHWEAA